MNGRRITVLLFTAAVALLFIGTAAAGPLQRARLSPLEQLGKKLYFDQNLSLNGNQACATCHAPEAGFAGPDSEINAFSGIYPGSVETLFGNRRPPTSAYAGDAPLLYYDDEAGAWIGGTFWDGRATGWILGDPLAEQAKGPFLNPVEHAVPDAQTLCDLVATSNYAMLFLKVWDLPSFDCADSYDTIYDKIGYAIAAYEQAPEVNPYSSRFDAWVRAGEPADGGGILTTEELWGLSLFEGEQGMCSTCHTSAYGPDGQPRSADNLPVFTGFTYHNVGLPPNPNNPWYTMPAEINPDGEDWIDYGLGGFLEASGYPYEVYSTELGRQKVPTLRNVDKGPYEAFVKAYMHNGYFTDLYDVVHFFNTRDVVAWPEAEVPLNVNMTAMGDLGLTYDEEMALVAFMKTLSDGYVP